MLKEDKSKDREPLCVAIHFVTNLFYCIIKNKLSFLKMVLIALEQGLFQTVRNSGSASERGFWDEDG